MNAHGQHIFLDFTGYEAPVAEDGAWMLDVLERAVAQSDARNVHAHVAQFDGSVSPPGFAAVVLIDESHVTAHCYADRGLLAIDCFTCGDTDPDTIATYLHDRLVEQMPALQCVRRQRVDRFITEV